MTKPSPIDRDTAARINPIIGCFTEDTLAATKSMLTDIGYLLSVVENTPSGIEPVFGNISLFFNSISSALAYEIENPRLSGANVAKQGEIA